MSLLTIDVGTSSIRAAIVDDDGRLRFALQRANLPDTPFPGLVEFDAAAMARMVIELGSAAIERAGDVKAVGLTNQRASAVVWDRLTGTPVAPGLGWQDLRTIGLCLELRGDGHVIGPNETATKVSAILDQVDPERAQDLCVGTVDSWLAWSLSNGASHVTDMSNAAVTGLWGFDTDADGTRAAHGSWKLPVLNRLGIAASSLPTVVDSTGVFGQANALPGAPPLAAILGDQQSSLLGQGCVHSGQAKITFGTGAMLDMLAEPSARDRRSEHGTFPIIAWGSDQDATWGVEAVMLTAGATIEWLVNDLGLIASPAESEELAASVASTGDVWFVPALLGLATPSWDYGARGALLGLTRGSGRAEVVRAVLNGIAQRGADLVDAAVADTGVELSTIRVDGGMSVNATFVQLLADAVGRPVEVAVVPESTALGAAYAAGLAIGTWADWNEIGELWAPRLIVDPSEAEPQRLANRARWAEASRRSTGWYPELSALDF